MAWFKRKTDGSEGKASRVHIAEGLWIKCDSCKEIIYRAEVERAGRVCPKCNYPFRISARERITLLADPGSCDITAGVDVHALAAHARALGLAVWGPVTQRDALLALGFREWDRHARGRQAAASNAGRGAESIRVYSARTRAGLLVDPAGLGGFHALCLGVGTDRPPLAVRDAPAAAAREPRPSR